MAFCFICFWIDCMRFIKISQKCSKTNGRSFLLSFYAETGKTDVKETSKSQPSFVCLYTFSVPKVTRSSGNKTSVENFGLAQIVTVRRKQF